MDISNKNNLLFNDFLPTETSEWMSVVEKDLKGRDFTKTLVWETDEGIEVQPFYRSENISLLSEVLKSTPGEFPYLRGNEASNNSWNINVVLRGKTNKEANENAVNAIKNGADSVTYSTELADNETKIAELLKGIDTENNYIYFGTGKETESRYRQIFEYIKKNGKPIKGGFFLDPFKSLIVTGKSDNVESTLSNIKAFIQHSDEKLPLFKAFTVQSSPFKSSGGNIVEELAFTLNSAVEYIAKLTDLGLGIDSICQRMMFSFSIGSSYFMEIAKLRAARLLWAKIIENHCPENKSSCKMNIHAHTSNFNKTIYDPHVNILRGTTECMAAAIGGAELITVNPFDPYYKTDDEFSERIARNTQLMIRNEAHLNKVKDPGAGSYYIEKLTESVSLAALELFKDVEKLGGLIGSLEKGFIQERIQQSRTRLRARSSARKKVFLGTNQYPNTMEKILDKLDENFKFNTENMDTIESNLHIQPLKPFRGSEDFDKLRLKTERYSKINGRTPSVFLLQLGNLRMRRARANFSYNLFGCAGFRIIDNSGYPTIESGVKDALDSDSEIVVICSSNDEYPDIVPETVKQIRNKKPRQIIIVAGFSSELSEKLKNSGIDDFIHTGTDAINFLNNYLNRLGIKNA